jgi:WD40-like Beta Propeller Repeat
LRRDSKRPFVGAVRQLPSAEKALGEQREFVSEPPTDRRSSEQALAGVFPSSARRSRRGLAALAATALAILAIGAAVWWRSRLPDRSQWVQLTKFPDSVSEPALSPDGHMLAFIRGYGLGQVYIKILPDGEPVQLAGDNLFKTGSTFSPDGSRVAYTTMDPEQFAWDTWVVPTLGGKLIAKEAANKFAWYRNPGELRIADLETGRSEPVVRGLDVLDYDISADGRQVVTWTTDSEGKSRLWLATFDHRSHPVEIPNVEGTQPRFGPDGDILFRQGEFVYRVHPNGTRLRQAFAEPVYLLWSVSPDGKWIVGWAPLPDNGPPAMQAFPLDGGSPVQIGGSLTFLSWSLDGRSVLLGGSYLVPLQAGRSFPRIPNGGLHSREEIARLAGARQIDAAGVVPGPSADVYAFHRGTVQRNLYRIPIP